jgi:OmpA-OmpF porin, OOP family
MKNLLRIQLIGLPVLVLMACSSTPPVAEFPSNADPNQEISRMDAKIAEADTRQLGVLSPKNFEKASDCLDKAKEARSNGKDPKSILKEVALSEGYLNKAEDTEKLADSVLAGVKKERQNAIAANAHTYFPKEFTAVDEDLKDVSGDLESNKTDSAKKMSQDLEGRYNALEMDAIRKAKMGDARAVQEEADKEGARKLVPQTWAWADRKISADNGIITADRHNTAVVEKASQDAKFAANRLLNLVRIAKNSKQENPEDVALQLEKGQNQVEIQGQALSQAHENISNLDEQNRKLAAQTALDEKYNFARQQFSPEEADVYKSGDKILIRLKGLSFATNAAVLGTANYPLLGKVEKVINETKPESVVIEGHADATGPKKLNAKLSQKRAEAVEGYLVANSDLEQDKVQAKGVSDEKPLASNKTSTGRALNRRVDVIITPQQAVPTEEG